MNQPRSYAAQVNEVLLFGLAGLGLMYLSHFVFFFSSGCRRPATCTWGYLPLCHLVLRTPWAPPYVTPNNPTVSP